MLKKIIVQTVLVVWAVGMTTSCATISESECVAGNWADLGYRDGVDGRSRSRIADYVKKCGEYGQNVDRSLYLSSYETGLTHYCVYDKGFSLGETGNSYNSVCQGEGAAQFRAGYDNGFAKYELRQAYDQYEYDIHEVEDKIEDVRKQLGEPDLTDDQRTDLRRQKKRLNADLSDLVWDFREFKRKYGF